MSQWELMADELKTKMDELVRGVLKHRIALLEEFAKAYIVETGLNPSEVELVETRTENSIVWTFEKKKEK